MDQGADKTSIDILAPSVPGGILRDQASAFHHRVTHKRLHLRAQPCSTRDLTGATGTFLSDDVTTR